MREMKPSDFKYKPLTPPEPPQIDCDGAKTLSPEQYSLPLLPDEIIENEILPRLPVKSLLRFRCVSKSWWSMIGARWFVKNHYRNSTKDTSLARRRVIFNWMFQDTRQCSLQSMLDQTSVHPSLFDEEADNGSITRDAYIMGCCNGLFCLVNYDKGCFFWNPATKKFFRLPKVPKIEYPFQIFIHKPKRGFCWDETAGAYQVFATLFDTTVGTSVARVYNSKTNLWTAVEIGSLSLYDEVGVYTSGCLHWIAKKSGDHPCHIESFDLRRRSFGKIGMPLGEVDGFFYLRLGEVRGCIGLLREVDGATDLWVMKEHGVEESWQKLVRVRGNCFGGRRLFSAPCGEMVLVSGRNFLVFSGGDVKATRKRKRISHGEGEAKSEESHEGWFSGLKGLLRRFYEYCNYPSVRRLDYVVSYDTYFYVESLASPIID